MGHHVERNVIIDATSDKVWEVLADLPAIETWALGLQEATVEGAPGEGAVRRCAFVDGVELEETMTHWDEGELIGYGLDGDLPFEDAEVRWTLESTGPATRVTYRLDFSGVRNKSQPAAAAEGFGPVIDQLLAGLKHYVETGEPMPPPEDEEED